MAGKFQFEDQNDPSSGRSTMQQGLRSNPSSTHLWLEVFTFPFGAKFLHPKNKVTHFMFLPVFSLDTVEIKTSCKIYFKFLLGI